MHLPLRLIFCRRCLNFINVRAAYASKIQAPPTKNPLANSGTTRFRKHIRQEKRRMMERIKRILPADRQAMALAKEHWNTIAKPIGSLGRLEEAIIQIAGITGNPDVRLDHRAAVVMCADNGVVAEGVTQTDSSVTARVAETIAAGSSSINCMAAVFGAEVRAVDIGMRDEADPASGVICRRVRTSTGNIANEPAMTLEEAARAVSVGINMAEEMKKNGVEILVTGEMGIGNTTTAAALACALLGKKPEELTGRGAGLDEAGLQRKVAAVSRAIARNREDMSRPLALLASLGGLDIAGMTGLFLGGAIYRIPTVIDGVISAVAAQLACLLAPNAADYMLASHVSAEPAASLLLQRIGKKPLICGELRLGEGTGGILLLPLLDGALSVYHSTHRFEALHMEAYQDYSRKGRNLC